MSHAAPRADAPPPTVTVSDHPIRTMCTTSPWALLWVWPHVVAAPQPSRPHGSAGSPEEHPAAFSPSSIDSPNSSMENPLDTTGDITVEEVKDFLA